MPNRINLKAIHSAKETYRYSINSDFFNERENSLINDGELDVCVDIQKNTAADIFVVRIKIDGDVVVACDRCLDDLEYPIEVDEEVKVKFGAKNEDTELFTVVNESDGLLDVDSLIYDYTVLEIPIHPVHADGDCNESMLDKLKEYTVQ